MPVAWNSRLVLGVPILDEQHREIIRRARSVLEGMRERRGDAELHRLFTSLRAYIRNHFATEEMLMRVSGYPGLPEHAREHLQLRRRLTELSEHLDAVGPIPTVIVATNAIVCEWFFDHVAESDGALATFLDRDGARGDRCAIATR